MTPADRFWAKVDKDGPTPPHRAELGPCWVWRGKPTTEGYGAFRFGGKYAYAHRVSFFLEHGRWPEPCGLHKCDNRICVRPGHLFEGTRPENTADMHAKGRGRKSFGPTHWSHTKRAEFTAMMRTPARLAKLAAARQVRIDRIRLEKERAKS